jgi:hypothetical protein
MLDSTLLGLAASALHLDNPSHDEWMFKVAFSSNDDEVIADAVTVWIIGGDQTPPGSFVSYFAKRAQRAVDPSPQGCSRWLCMPLG